MHLTYELILAEYFDLPEDHKFFDIVMEFGTEADDYELVVTDSHVEIWGGNTAPTVEDLVQLSQEFLINPWFDVAHMLEVFSEELNSSL